MDSEVFAQTSRFKGTIGFGCCRSYSRCDELRMEDAFMTVKERLRRIIDELPEELPETAIEATENALRPYQKAIALASGFRPVTAEERRARVYAIAGRHRETVPSSEQIAEWKREEIAHDEERSERRRREASNQAGRAVGE